MIEQIHEIPKGVDQIHAERRFLVDLVFVCVVHIHGTCGGFHGVMLEEHAQQDLAIFAGHEVRDNIELHHKLADSGLELLEGSDHMRQHRGWHRQHVAQGVGMHRLRELAADGVAQDGCLPSQEFDAYGVNVLDSHLRLGVGRLLVHDLLKERLVSCSTLVEVHLAFLEQGNFVVQLLCLVLDPVGQGLHDSGLHHELAGLWRQEVANIPPIEGPLQHEIRDGDCRVLELVAKEDL
mmetsp:Transcript_35659/g.70936  ORF Transcript_35659/g.70936 Transcript_35659/m.70936 type:complete len:236 (-) Transcript_35659:114-821(-)